ncbi:hypothetical protein L1049_020989 [Liquidambar formosana]|uniref:Uncharacterized protein n=1 Tax=Liquidambar formosana TaxID=63359 RepID=A0AAP0XB31_LIQFO
MEYFKIFFALSVAFIVAAVLFLNNKLNRIMFKEPSVRMGVESQMPAELPPEKGQNLKGTKLVANVPLNSPEAEKLLRERRILTDSLQATTSNVFPVTTLNGTQLHSSQGKNVVYGAGGIESTNFNNNSFHHAQGIATGPSPSKGNNEVTGIGGIGDTIMMGCFKGIKNIDISGGGSPSLDGGVPKNVVNGIGGIGSTKIKDSFENIESLKISRR